MNKIIHLHLTRSLHEAKKGGIVIIAITRVIGRDSGDRFEVPRFPRAEAVDGERSGVTRRLRRWFGRDLGTKRVNRAGTDPRDERGSTRKERWLLIEAKIIC